MKIFVITAEKEIDNEIKRIDDLLAQDVEAIHVRKPGMHIDEMRYYLSSLGENTNKCMLHQHHALAKEFSVKGLHFTEAARKAGKHLNVADKGIVLSSSFHQMADLKHETFAFDYGFISPVFDSISKPGYNSTFNKEQLFDMNNKTPFPLVALGGVRKDKIKSLECLGFWGVALLGDIWKN